MSNRNPSLNPLKRRPGFYQPHRLFSCFRLLVNHNDHGSPRMLRSWCKCPSTLVTSCRQPNGGSVGEDENRRGARPYHFRLPRGWLLALALAEDRSARGDVGMRASVSAKPTSTTASSTTPTAIATTTATSSEAGHLGKARINVLLGLLQDVDKLTGLLLVCVVVSIECGPGVRCMWEYSLSVVKKVMAVPFAPARPVRPIRWM